MYKKTEIIPPTSGDEVINKGFHGVKVSSVLRDGPPLYVFLKACRNGVDVDSLSVRLTLGTYLFYF